MAFFGEGTFAQVTFAQEEDPGTTPPVILMGQGWM